VHQKSPIQNPSFPPLEAHSRCFRELESPKYPAKKHTHLHERQVLPCAVCWSVREREERSRVVLSSGRTGAEPSFWQERIWRMEVSGVPMNAVRVKRELRFLRNDPAYPWYRQGSSRRIGVIQLTNFQTLLFLYLCPRSIASRLVLVVEGEVSRFCLRQQKLARTSLLQRDAHSHATI
jgi:hypothetical protein